MGQHAVKIQPFLNYEVTSSKMHRFFAEFLVF